MTERIRYATLALGNATRETTDTLTADLVTFSRSSFIPSPEWNNSLPRRHSQYRSKIESIGRTIQLAYNALVGKDRPEVLAFGRYLLEESIVAKRSEYTFIMILIIAHGHKNGLSADLLNTNINGQYGNLILKIREDLGLEERSKKPQKLEVITLEGMVKDILTGERDLLP